jgi:hypothetical protein
MRDLAGAIHELLQQRAKPVLASAAAPAAAAEPAARTRSPRRSPRVERRPGGSTPLPRAEVSKPPTAAATAAAAPRSTGLVGSSKTMPLLSVFQFLGRTRKSGRLEVRIANEKMVFEFVAGCVQAATTDHVAADERLGDILVERGIVHPRAIADAVAGAGEAPSRQLAAKLVAAGLITNGHALEALERQVHLRFRRACQSSEAEYEFVEGSGTTGDGRINIMPFELVHEHKKSDRTH